MIKLKLNLPRHVYDQLFKTSLMLGIGMSTFIRDVLVKFLPSIPGAANDNQRHRSHG